MFLCSVIEKTPLQQTQSVSSNSVWEIMKSNVCSMMRDHKVAYLLPPARKPFHRRPPFILILIMIK